MSVDLKENDQGTTESLKDFALRLLDFHGGQDSALYSVGSCMLAGDYCWTQAVDGAVSELKAFARDTRIDVMAPWWDPKLSHRYTKDGLLARKLARQLLKHRAHKERLDKLDAFTQGYLECVCFTTDDGAGSGEYSENGRSLPLIETLPQGCLDAAVEDCAEFQKRASALLAEAYEQPGYDETRAGHDFWFTRCRHGVGYWDRARDLDIVGDKLTDLAQAFGERWASIDNGVLYID